MAKTRGGIGFFGLLTLIFITLKLCGTIGWSWFWVLLPVFAPLILWLAIMACLAVAYLVVHMVERKRH